MSMLAHDSGSFGPTIKDIYICVDFVLFNLDRSFGSSVISCIVVSCKLKASTWARACTQAHSTVLYQFIFGCRIHFNFFFRFIYYFILSLTSRIPIFGGTQGWFDWKIQVLSQFFRERICKTITLNEQSNVSSERTNEWRCCIAIVYWLQTTILWKKIEK